MRFRAFGPFVSAGAIATALLIHGGPAAIPAFPDAEGAGAQTTGGRTGTVYQVTNLKCEGPGSLAEAVSQPNRIVVFAVSGTIDLAGSGKRKRSLEIAHPNVTIAGQTAPGEGICIRGGSIRVMAGNVIIRHLRVRRGFNVIGEQGDAINIKGDFADVIVDHVSASWGSDETLTLTNANRVTAQYSIASEGLDYFNPNQSPNRHSEGSLFGSGAPGGVMTIHHTLYAHNRLRNARTTGGSEPPPNLDFRNNVVYDWKEYATHTGSEVVHLNLVNNFYREGPSTGVEDPSARVAIFTFMKDVPYRLFASGNVLDGYPDLTRDNWRAIRIARPDRPHQYDLRSMRSGEAFATPPVTTQQAKEAFETVLSEAGATLPARDAIDLRVVNDVRHRTGAVINFETDIPEAGRWQNYHSLPAPLDRDGDGVPDYWEEQFGLGTNSALRKDPRGYLNIEDYFNNGDPRGTDVPLVFISASVSRAYRGDGRAGELRIHRTGDRAKPLTVRYTIDGGEARSIGIPAGSESAAIPVAPGAGETTVGTVAPGPGYHIGCPISALVATEDGASPTPVDIAGVDPKGGVSDEIRKIGEANMQGHKKDKTIKHKTLYPQ